MRILIVVFAISFITGCIKKSEINHVNNRERVSNEIKRKVAMQLKKEKNLYPFGSGGGGVGKIWMMYLAFNYYEQVDIGRARELLIDAVNVFLKTINEDQRIHPYLENYPFRPKNIEMRIFFKKPDGSDIVPGKLCLVALDNYEELRYEISDPETKHLITIHRETFSEAIEQLKVAVSF